MQESLIAPGLHSCGLAGGINGQVIDAGTIPADLFALNLEADFVVCGVTVHNANVCYELGVRHALRKKFERFRDHGRLDEVAQRPLTSQRDRAGRIQALE